MKVILNTDNAFQSLRLREQIISGIKGELDNVTIDTWAFTKSGENYDILYHNPSQYVEDPQKNVLFKMDIDGSNISFSIVWWKRNPEPSEDMKCLHVGRLTEMLLYHFRSDFIKLSVID